MLNQIATFETIARSLEPPQAQRSAIATAAHEYIDTFIEALPAAPAFSTLNRERISLPFEDHGKPFGQILANLRTEVDHDGINSASGAHLGYIPGGGIWASAIADMLAAATNRYAGLHYSCPGAVRIENQVLRWLCNMVGYPDTAHGNISAGGSMANLIAIQTARDAFGIHAGNVKNAVVYFTAHAHHCIQKALRITGLHEAVHRVIPVNSRYQMDTERLNETMANDKANGLIPFLVIATAGTTNAGAIDPLNSIADICAQYKTWFHIDGAYGGLFKMADSVSEKFAGMERADSLVMDPHKSLFIPYGAGIVLVKNAAHLLAANNQTAAYMQDAYGVDEISPSDCSPELSKHFRGLRIWLPLQLHGLAPFKANLEEKLLLCRYFHEAIGSLGFETGPDPDLSVSLFRIAGDAENTRNEKFLAALHADGRSFFSSTVIHGKLWIRCAVLSFRTHLPEIENALVMIREVSLPFR